MGEQLNINITTTGAESPWSNGIVKKHNSVISNLMEKVLADVNCSLEVALGWRLSAKNSLLNSYGYSPNQLVRGYNPNFLSVMDNKLWALSRRTSSEVIACHLNVLHSARRRFIETEADDKLRPALRHKTRTTISFQYQTGDQVYYKKGDSRYWKGQGTVIGYDDKQVFVRHGGSYLRINPCNLQQIKNAKKVQQPEEVEYRSDTESREKKEITQNGDDLADMIDLDNKVKTPHNTQECLTDEEN